MREELFWDRNGDQAPAEIVIERAINFGGFGFPLSKKYRKNMAWRNLSIP